MWRKVAKGGAVKTERNRSRSERKVGVSCTCGLLVARGPGRGATSRIIPRRKEVAIPLAYPAPEKVRNRNLVPKYLEYPEIGISSRGLEGHRLKWAIRGLILVD